MMSGLQRKSKSPFATPEKENLTPKVISPSETFGGKKGFLSNIFSKKKAVNESEPQPNLPISPPQPFQIDNRTKLKQKIVNRKNIADGLIRLNVFPNDRVPEDFLIDYKDNPFEWLDQNPARTSSFIENLRSRDFSMINNREVKQFMDSQQQQKDIAPPLGVNNLELELMEVAKSYDSFLGKFFRFFQGLLAGFCIISLFLIFAGSNDQVILTSFVVSSLRVYQIFQVVALLCVIGALHRYLGTRSQYIEAGRSRPHLKNSLSKQLVKYLIASLSFAIVYGIIIFNHEFISLISDRGSTLSEPDFRTRFKVFRTLSAIKTFFAILGWFVLVLAFEEVTKDPIETINYSEMTMDEHEEEENRRNP